MHQPLQEPQFLLSRLLNVAIKWHKWVSEKMEILHWSQKVCFNTNCKPTALIRSFVYQDMRVYEGIYGVNKVRHCGLKSENKFSFKH